MRFWFHYNKPASARRNRPTISLYFKQRCHLVNNLVVDVPTKSRMQTLKQSHFLMVGDALNIEVDGESAHIYDRPRR